MAGRSQSTRKYKLHYSIVRGDVLRPSQHGTNIICSGHKYILKARPLRGNCIHVPQEKMFVPLACIIESVIMTILVMIGWNSVCQIGCVDMRQT